MYCYAYLSPNLFLCCFVPLFTFALLYLVYMPAYVVPLYVNMGDICRFVVILEEHWSLSVVGCVQPSWYTINVCSG